MLNKFTIQKSFAISAGAGSGKTYTLSRKYISEHGNFRFDSSDDKYCGYCEIGFICNKSLITKVINS